MTVTAAIMQPTYLPYLGYFQLMAASDVFVFLDDVQFARRSWQSRNRILTADGELMLTVPVKKHDRDTAISDIEIDDGQGWRDKHLAAMRHAYGKRPGFAEGFAFVSEQLALHQGAKLADLTCGMAVAAAGRMGLSPRFERASQARAPRARGPSICWRSAEPWAPRSTSRRWARPTTWKRTASSRRPDFPARFQAFRSAELSAGIRRVRSVHGLRGRD
jgi:hypothetical protein